jgi:hypothetical protein
MENEIAENRLDMVKYQIVNVYFNPGKKSEEYYMNNEMSWNLTSEDRIAHTFCKYHFNQLLALRIK